MGLLRKAPGNPHAATNTANVSTIARPPLSPISDLRHFPTLLPDSWVLLPRYAPHYSLPMARMVGCLGAMVVVFSCLLSASSCGGGGGGGGGGGAATNPTP